MKSARILMRGWIGLTVSNGIVDLVINVLFYYFFRHIPYRAKVIAG
jgi:hypothetical protein